MFNSLLSPDMYIKVLLKQQLPKLRDDLETMIENLFTQVADEKELNPFELILTLSCKDNLSIARIFDGAKVNHAQLDAGQLIKDVFKQQLGQFPESAQDYILNELGGNNIEQLLSNFLKAKTILIHYGEKGELQAVQITKTDKKHINLDEIFHNFNF